MVVTQVGHAFFHSNTTALHIMIVNGGKASLNLGALQRLSKVTMSAIRTNGVFAIRIAPFHQILVIMEHTSVESCINTKNMNRSRE